MPFFQYQAINRSGQTIHGRIEAQTAQAAISLLAEQGRFVDTIEVVSESEIQKIEHRGGITRRLRLTNTERADFIRQLATALKAQLPILSALDVVGRQNPNRRILRLTGELTDIVKSGQSLSYALSCYPRSFGQLHTSLVGIGETAGNLDRSMTQLADLVERELEIRNNILTAALYPLFVLCLGLLSVAIVITWIMPRVLTTLAGGSLQLPLPTRMVMAMSDFLQSPAGWLTMAGLLFLFLALNAWRHHGLGRDLYDSLKLRTPLLGSVQRKWAISRFARTLGTLSQSGINILDSLQIVRNCMGNEILARDIDRVIQQVRTGATLSAPLRKSNLYPPLLLQIVSVGEQTGQLATMLLNAAEAFDRETNVAIRRFLAIFPAILITLLAIVIGFIVAATLLPIVQIETALPRLS